MGRPTAQDARACPYCGAHNRRGAGVCRVCAEQTLRRLRELPGWWEELQTTIIRQSKLQPAGGGSASGDDWKWPYDIRASHAADAVRATLAAWVRTNVHMMGEDAPSDSVPAYCAYLSAWHAMLARRDDYVEFVDDIHRVTGRIMRVVDYSDVRASIPVGPCPLPDDEGGYCTGSVYAHFPQSKRDGWPPIMGCDQVDEHWWDALRWRRAGRDIAARKAELAKARELASAICGRR